MIATYQKLSNWTGAITRAGTRKTMFTNGMRLAMPIARPRSTPNLRPTSANAVLSVSALSLKAFGMLRWMLVIELSATLVTATLAIGWIPAWGAVGAGWAVAIGSLGQGLLTFAAMQWLTGLRPLTRRSIGLGLSVVAATLTLWGIQQTWALPLWASVPAAGVLSTAVLFINRDLLSLANTFPELGRIPLVGRLAR